MSDPRYPYVRVDVVPAEADIVAGEFFELGAQGIEERDGGTLAQGPSKDLVRLVASFESHEAAEEAIAALRQTHPHLSPQLEEVVGDAWRDEWKKHYKPFLLTKHVIVCPPWESPPAQNPECQVLTLEPGRAFGTGLHATTSLVAEMLDAEVSLLRDATVLDLGTGSGILSLTALLLGAASATGVDVDPEALRVARENAARNRLLHRVELIHGGVDVDLGTFPIVIANIESSVLVPQADQVLKHLKSKGRLFLSGILEAEQDVVIQRYTTLARPLRLVRSTRRGQDGDGWVCLQFEATW